MPTLHDPSCRDSIKSRLRALNDSAQPKWGQMSVDQMLWHAAGAMEICMGRLKSRGDDKAPPLPKPILRLIVLNFPWPKGVPTLSVVRADARYNLESERTRCLNLIDEFTKRSLEAPWPEHPTLGKMTGPQYSRLQAKHFNHHLTQFGV
jgi:hypothetical protein